MNAENKLKTRLTRILMKKELEDFYFVTKCSKEVQFMKVLCFVTMNKKIFPDPRLKQASL